MASTSTLQALACSALGISASVGGAGNAVAFRSMARTSPPPLLQASSLPEALHLLAEVPALRRLLLGVP